VTGKNLWNLIEKVRRKTERVYIPETYQQMVETTSKNVHVIKVSQDFIYNFSEYTKPFYKKIIIGINKSKFTIMAYEYMEYTSEGLFCSISGHSSGNEKFILEKKGVDNNIQSLCAAIPKLLYNVLLAIKSAKFVDVQCLASKYVPPEYIWFYSSLVEETSSYQDNNGTISNDEDYYPSSNFNIQCRFTKTVVF